MMHDGVSQGHSQELMEGVFTVSLPPLLSLLPFTLPPLSLSFHSSPLSLQVGPFIGLLARGYGGAL